MDPKKEEANIVSIIVSVFCIVMGAAGGISMQHIISHINGWQAAAYAIVAGIFVAIAAVMLDRILSFFCDD